MGQINFLKEDDKAKKAPVKRIGRYGIITLSALLVSLVAVAGSLTPPGAPASTMRTLQEIYDTVVGPFDSSLITSDPDGSVIQGLKYVSENLPWSLSGSDIYNNNTGNVGIGTTGPQYTLDVLQATTGTIARFNTHAFLGEFDGGMFVSGGGFIDASGSWHSTGLGGYASLMLNNPYFGYGTIALEGSSSDVDDSQGTFAVFFPDGSFAIGGDYQGLTASSSTIYGLSDGNVGIGTDAPITRFDVAGITASGFNSGTISIRASENLEDPCCLRWIDFNNPDGSPDWAILEQNGQLQFYNAALDEQPIVIDIDGSVYLSSDGGNVGIGTTSPTTQLDVIGNASVSSNFEVGGNLSFLGEIQPDGATCANGQILKKTGANDWDCATDDTGGGGVASDSLDFDEFEDAMNLDANTTVTGGLFALTFDHASVSGNFEVAGYSSSSAVFGAGLTDCDAESQTLNWDATTGRFSCLTDGTGSGGASIGMREGFTGGFTNKSSISFNAPHFVLDTSNPDARLSLDWGTGGPASLSQNETVLGQWTFAAHTTFSAGASMAGNFDPAVDDTYDLGDTSFRWKDIYLGPGSMHIGTSTADEYVVSYDTTSNYLGFNANGTGDPEVVFNSSGNVGIGTTAPTFDLHVTGAGNTTLANNLALFQSNPSTATNLYMIAIEKSGVASLMMGVNKNSTTGSVPASVPFISTYATTQALSIGRGGANDLPSTSDIYIDTAGNIGIGTTSPAVKLDVLGAGANLTGTAFANVTFEESASPKRGTFFGYDTSGQIGIIGANTTGITPNNLAFWSFNGSSWLEAMRINPSGNVGIGTTNPLFNLHVNGASAGNITATVQNTTNGASSLAVFELLTSTSTGYFFAAPSGYTTLPILTDRFSMYSESDSGGVNIVANGASGDIRMYTGAALAANERLRITNTGNVGIGTTAPAQLLDIGGSAANITFSHATGPHQIITAGTSDLALIPGGNVGIGTTSAAAKLAVNGNLLFTAGTPTISPSTAGTSLSIDSNGAGALNLNNTATGDVLLAGGVGATGCTVTNSTGAFSCAGNITTTATGTPTAGFWTRNTASGFLYPTTIGDNVGIGTSAPGANLHVRGPGNTTGANQLAFFQSNPSTATNLYMMTIEKSGVASLMMGINKNSTTGSVPASVPFISTYATDQALSIGRGGANDLPSTSDIYIDTAGNVGIGTTSPLFNLHVRGASAGNITTTVQNTTNGAGSLAVFTAVSADSTGYFFIAPSGYTTIPILTDRFSMYSESDSGGVNIVANGASGDIRMYTGAALAANERLRITNTGDVGIGDASPAALFVVGATDAFQVNSSGRVQANVGASGAGNLAYSFVGDTDLGLYRSAADEIRFQTAGTDKVTINSAGNVGIGTTAPDFNLHVRGAGNTTLANNLALFTSNPTTATNLYMIAIEKSGVASLMMGVNKNSVTGSVPASVPFISTYATTQALSIGRGGANDLPSTSDIYIDTAGNIGIGTTTVGAKLAVNGNLLFTAATPTISPSTAGTSLSIDSNGMGSLNLNNTATGDILMAGGVGVTGCTLTNSNGNFSCSGDITTTATGTPTAGFWTRNTASGFLYPSTIGDNVGIGTSTGLTHKLKVEGSIFASTQATAVNEVVTAGRTISPGTGMSGGGALTGDLTLSSTTWSSSSSHIISLGAGNVGVGTGVVTPGSKLQVNGNAAIGYSAAVAAPANGLAVSGATALGYASSPVAPANGLAVFGNVGIGSTAPTEALNVVGNILATGNITTIAGTVSATQLSGNCNLAATVPDDGGGGPDPVTFTDSNCADYAELYQSSEPVHPGDLLVFDPTNPGKVKRSSGAGTSNIMGIVSTSPAAVVGYGKFVGGQIAAGYNNPNRPAVALVGRAPVKISLENGPIAVGDHLTASSITGVAMKATEAGMTVGVAMESPSTTASGSYATVLTFVNVGYWAPDVESLISDTSLGIQISPTSIFSSVLDYLGDAILEVRKLVAGTVKTKNFEIEDSATGDMYCVRIVNGEWDKQEGECSSAPASPSTTPSETPAEDPDTDTDPTAQGGEPLTESPSDGGSEETSESAPEPESETAPESEPESESASEPETESTSTTE